MPVSKKISKYLSLHLLAFMNFAGQFQVMEWIVQVGLCQYFIQAPVLFAGRLPAKPTRAEKH